MSRQDDLEFRTPYHMEKPRGKLFMLVLSLFIIALLGLSITEIAIKDVRQRLNDEIVKRADSDLYQQYEKVVKENTRKTDEVLLYKSENSEIVFLWRDGKFPINDKIKINGVVFEKKSNEKGDQK